LSGFQDKELEQAPVIVDGDSPFPVVIVEIISFGEINPRTPIALYELWH
jgi:hypothetical protein